VVHAASVVLTVVAEPLWPISVAVAVLREQLYGRGPVLRRSLVYSSLLACGLAVFATTVLILDMVRGCAGPAVMLAATAAVAVRIERSVDRLLFGERSQATDGAERPRGHRPCGRRAVDIARRMDRLILGPKVHPDT